MSTRMWVGTKDTLDAIKSRWSLLRCDPGSWPCDDKGPLPRLTLVEEAMVASVRTLRWGMAVVADLLPCQLVCGCRKMVVLRPKHLGAQNVPTDNLQTALEVCCMQSCPRSV